MGKRPQVDTLGILKGILYDFYKDKKIVEPAYVRITTKLDDKRIETIKKLVELVMNTDFFNEETKLFIGDYRIDYSGVADALSIKYNKEVNKRTVASKINYMKTKFERTFGDRMLLDLVIYTREDITEYSQKISEELYKFISIDILDNIDLNFEETNEIVTEVSEDDFSDFIDTIAPYTKKCKHIVEKSINKEVLAYIKHLSTNTSLSELDKERLKELKDLID